MSAPHATTALGRALTWQPPAGALWSGRWVDGEASFPVHDPEDHSLLGYVTDATEAEVHAAVRAVAVAVHGANWPAWQRREALTTAAALALAQILLDAGVPADRFGVVPGSGSRDGRTLAGHPQVGLVSFTGGPRTGDAVARAAGAKKTLMELGGNNAVLVLADADWRLAARAVVEGAFGVAGQNCLSVQRVFVAAPLAHRFTEHVAAGARALRVGSKTDPRTDGGSLIDEREAIRVEEWVDEAREGGAVACVGCRREGAFYGCTRRRHTNR